MSGGIAYIRTLERNLMNAEALMSGELQLHSLSDEDVSELRALLELHVELTGSQVAADILTAQDWAEFTKIVPRDWAAVRAIRARAAAAGDDPDTEQTWQKILEVTGG